MSKILSGFAAKFNYCWCCLRKPWDRTQLQIHHCARGVNRKKSRECEATLVRCCRECHDKHMDGCSHLDQIALIAINNPFAYDRLLYNEMRGRAPDSISEKEVICAIARLIVSRETSGDYIFLRGNQ